MCQVTSVTELDDDTGNTCWAYILPQLSIGSQHRGCHVCDDAHTLGAYMPVVVDDHPDVAMLSGISAEELANRLWKATDAELLEAYFIALGLDKDVNEGADGGASLSADLLVRAKTSFLNIYLESKEAQLAAKTGLKTAQVVAAFNEFDKDGSGNLDGAELQDLLTSLTIYANAEQCQSILQDIGGEDGLVDIKEFTDFLLQDDSDFQYESGHLRELLMAKLYAKRIASKVSTLRAADEGEDCVNTFSLEVSMIVCDVVNPHHVPS